jgi:hypothetical protein
MPEETEETFWARFTSNLLSVYATCVILVKPLVRVIALLLLVAGLTAVSMAPLIYGMLATHGALSTWYHDPYWIAQAVWVIVVHPVVGVPQVYWIAQAVWVIVVLPVAGSAVAAAVGDRDD